MNKNSREPKYNFIENIKKALKQEKSPNESKIRSLPFIIGILS